MRVSIVIFSLIVLFSCQGSSSFEACENHFNLEGLISEEIERLRSEQVNAIKIIQSGSQVETVELSKQELYEHLNDLVEFNIDLPNLLGRYSCNTTYESADGMGRHNFTAEYNNLSVREFSSVISKEGSVEAIEAVKTVGSFLARVQKELKWDLRRNTVKLHIRYDNFMGREREYFITIEY